MTIAVEKVLYTARATADGGRDGKVATDDGKLDVVVAPPAEMGGSGNGTNPEQLFAAGYAACFHSALKVVARKARHDVDASTVTAEVGIGPINGGAGYGLQVALVVSLPGLDRAVAEQLVAAAHEVCPYSNATRGNIAVDLKVA
ncbi:organic hydroperoxide resistance protein [Kribbella solani]|uniref:Ohr subfamily peroxiredoxin n=1 Tax=Kribbella solani TaxID=236067 RepID=A0A841DHP4_9ACTN|nr:organic hydroperoxide resistance protein [Kribbella solani]MBB5978664.1 Ohr subfamily peroxiredoxin [Kribbella solani]MDX2974132.1 organic hydroperoxide resistance protein [Kribbella solani]MDX3004899.1 organic hydroperoxide resistance protein [Kribbella solani]